MKKIQLATKIWIKWCYNWYEPEEFIAYICEKTGKTNIKDHLLEKWNRYYDLYGCRSVMNDFYLELDSDLQDALVDYALNVYGPIGMMYTYKEYSKL